MVCRPVVSQGSVRGQSEVSPAEVIDRLVKKIRVFNDTVHIFTNCLSKYLLVFQISKSVYLTSNVNKTNEVHALYMHF